MFGENYSKRCDEEGNELASQNASRNDEEIEGDVVLEWGSKHPSKTSKQKKNHHRSEDKRSAEEDGREKKRIRSVKDIVQKRDEAAGFFMNKPSHTPFLHLSEQEGRIPLESADFSSSGNGNPSSPLRHPSHYQNSSLRQTKLPNTRLIKALEEMEDYDGQSELSSEVSSSSSSTSRSTSRRNSTRRNTHMDSGKVDRNNNISKESLGSPVPHLWNGSTREGKAVDGRPLRRRFPFCSLIVFIPSLVVVLFLVLFFWVGFSSGTAEPENRSPRALVFVIEGFSGEIFNSMMMENGGAHLPNIRRLMNNRGGVWAACPTVSDSRCARAVSVEEVIYGPPFDAPSSAETANATRTTNNNNGGGATSTSESRSSSGSSATTPLAGEQQNIFSVYSATSIASILSGVQPRHHRVWNNSIDSMKHYRQTSKVFPSFLKVTKDAADMSVTVVGTSHLLHSLGASHSCSEPGVVDLECSASDAENNGAGGGREGGGILSMPGVLQLECLASSSCNANVRRIHLPTSSHTMSNGISEQQFRQVLADIFGVAGRSTATVSPLFSYSSLSEEDRWKHLFAKVEGSDVPVNRSTHAPIATSRTSRASSVNAPIASTTSVSDLYVIHFDALAKRAESPYLRGFSYNLTSAEYRAQAYLIDAMIGETLAYVQERSEKELENWLVMGISDHGGNGKTVNEDVDWHMSSGDNGNAGSSANNADDRNHNYNFEYISPGYDDNKLLALLRASTVPFFMGTYTSFSYEKPYITLKPLENPTSQLDVFPTVLRWLSVAPFDDETEVAWQKHLSEGNSGGFPPPTFSSSPPDTDRAPQPVANDAPLTEKLKWRAWFEGKVQGICSSGISPEDCVR